MVAAAKPMNNKTMVKATKQITLQILLILFLSFLAIAFLIGQRFGFTWAGGDGYNPSVPLVSLSGDLVRRGEIVSTTAGEYQLLSNELINVGLDENTDLEIITLNKNQVELYVHRGRIIIDSSVNTSIRSDFVRTSFNDPGQVSFVYYDFLNKVSVIPLEDNPVSYQIAEQTGTTTGPIDISELEPYEVTSFEFQILNSTAEEFYNWFE
jgi:hypothetical protein